VIVEFPPHPHLRKQKQPSCSFPNDPHYQGFSNPLRDLHNPESQSCGRRSCSEAVFKILFRGETEVRSNSADDPSVLFPGVSLAANVKLDQRPAVFQARYLRVPDLGRCFRAGLTREVNAAESRLVPGSSFCLRRQR
jgi:hypothetical protein